MAPDGPTGRERLRVEQKTQQKLQVPPCPRRATTKFLELCRQCGSEQLAVRIVAAGRSTGAPGLPQGNDWTAWNADEMRAALEHLQHKLGR